MIDTIETPTVTLKDYFQLNLKVEFNNCIIEIHKAIRPLSCNKYQTSWSIKRGYSRKAINSNSAILIYRDPNSIISEIPFTAITTIGKALERYKVMINLLKTNKITIVKHECTSN